MTKNISGFCMDPVSAEICQDHYLSNRPTYTVLSTYAQTFLQKSLPTNDVPFYVQSYVNITSLSYIS